MGRGEPDFCICGHGEGEWCGMRVEKGQKVKN